jgi:hypothetical protein
VTTSLSPARLALSDFLYYGYLPSREVAERRAAWWARLLDDPDVPHFTTAAEARDLLVRIVGELVADLSKVKIGVTSGYDSRGVLGALLFVMPPDQIMAFTRGQPGNPDFDKARDFTKAVLPVHHLVGTQDAEFQAVPASPGPAPGGDSGPRQISPPTSQITKRIEGFDELPNLNGYLGGALSGSQLSPGVRGDFDAARERYLRSNRPFVPDALMAEFFPRAYDPGHMLPSRPMLPVSVMDPQDQLNFHYRQFQRIRLHASQFEPDELAEMSPKARARAKRRMSASRTPYTDPRWQKSWMLVPFEERLKQKFYRRYLAESYPRIFPDLVKSLAKEAKQEKAAAEAEARASALRPPLRRLRSGLGGIVRWLRPPPPPPPPSKAEMRARSALRTHTNWELLYERNEQFRTEYCDPLIESLAARRGLWFDPRRVHELAREEAYGYGTVLWGLLSMESAIRAGRLPEPD